MPVRPRNDPAQYDDLADQWWRPDGAFAALAWLAQARGRLLPPAARDGALLLDLACGGGLLARHVPPGYRHVGVDLNTAALLTARFHGVVPVRADIARLPFPDQVADVVVAGEVLEHVADLAAVVAEAARVLRPGGVLVCDTINATPWARFSLVTLGERLPGGPPPRIHDPALFVAHDRLVALCAANGITLDVHGLAPDPVEYVRWLVDRSRTVTMRPVRSLAGVYVGVGTKRA